MRALRVVTGPPTEGYKLHKLVRRNKGAVVATTLVLLVLVGGISGTIWGLIRAEKQRLIAEEQVEADTCGVSAALTICTATNCAVHTKTIAVNSQVIRAPTLKYLRSANP